jgi:double-stranded uracil-DNA glycosylase
MQQPYRPTRAEVLASAGKTIPDVIAPGLRVLFCGINPGLYSGATGHHFARPGNRFWRAIHSAGFTDRVLSPFEDQDLPRYGCGITNLVSRATAAADELRPEELDEGARRLRDKVRECRPRYLAVLGMGAYRQGFGQPRAVAGRQDMAIGDTTVWVLPNPSGLNANYQLEQLVALFGELYAAAYRPN